MKPKPVQPVSLQITPSGVQELEKSLNSGSCCPAGQWVTLFWTMLTTAGILRAASCPPEHEVGLHVGTGVDRGLQGKAGSVTAPSDTLGPMSLMWRTWEGPGQRQGWERVADNACLMYSFWLRGRESPNWARTQDGAKSLMKPGSSQEFCQRGRAWQETLVTHAPYLKRLCCP